MWSKRGPTAIGWPLYPILDNFCKFWNPTCPAPTINSYNPHYFSDHFKDLSPPPTTRKFLAVKIYPPQKIRMPKGMIPCVFSILSDWWGSKKKSPWNKEFEIQIFDGFLCTCLGARQVDSQIGVFLNFKRAKAYFVQKLTKTGVNLIMGFSVT